jgi:hypothetical protein
MFRIRRFGVIRTSNVVAFFYLVIVAIIFVPIASIVALATPANQSIGGLGAVGVLFFGLLAAIFYGIFGWIFTALACLLYNFAAGMIGGIEIQLEAVQPPPPPPVWGSANQPPNAITGTPPAATPPPAPPAG